MDSNTYTRLLELPNEQIHAKPHLRPQHLTQPPTYDRPTSTDNHPCTDPSPRRRPRVTAHEIYPVRSSPTQASQSPARHTASSSRGPQPSSCRGKGNPFSPTKGIPHSHRDPISDTLQGIHVPERINYTSTPPQHTLKPSASSCSLEKLENKYAHEERDSDLPLECAHFPLNPGFRERFWHLSKHFIALAGRPNDYLIIFFTCDTAQYKIYAKYDPFYLQFGFLHPTQKHKPQGEQGKNAAHYE